MQVLGPWSVPRLDAWTSRPPWPAIAEGPHPGDRVDRYTRVVGEEPAGPPLVEGPYRRSAHAILAYRIFPTWLVRGVLARAPVQAGDTVGIRYRIGPLFSFFFAARVIEVFDGVAGGKWRAGFRYRTLVGHPELGEETFQVIKDAASGSVEVELQSWSRPGTLLARGFAPLVRLLQIHASRAALDALALEADPGKGRETRRPPWGG